MYIYIYVHTGSDFLGQLCEMAHLQLIYHYLPVYPGDFPYLRQITKGSIYIYTYICGYNNDNNNNNDKPSPKSPQIVCINHSQMGGLLLLYPYYMCIYIYMHVCIYTYIHIYIYTQIHIYKYTYTHIYIDTYIHKYIYTYIHNVYIYICTYTCRQ